MDLRGDSERQAFLRDQMIKRGDPAKKDIFVPRIDSTLEPGLKVLDIGCGTGHIIAELAPKHEESSFIGLDISHSMLGIAEANIQGLLNVALVMGDSHRLPFADQSIDIIIDRLSPYSANEVLRVLRQNGRLLEYGLGPEANNEIREFFQDRIEPSSFAFPRGDRDWMQEVGEDLERSGFVTTFMEDYKDAHFYSDIEELMDLVEMVPLVRDFDRRRDRMRIGQIVQKYGRMEGIRTTWHYYIVEAVRE